MQLWSPSVVRKCLAPVDLHLENDLLVGINPVDDFKVGRVLHRQVDVYPFGHRISVDNNRMGRKRHADVTGGDETERIRLPVVSFPFPSPSLATKPSDNTVCYRSVVRVIPSLKREACMELLSFLRNLGISNAYRLAGSGKADMVSTSMCCLMTQSNVLFQPINIGTHSPPAFLPIGCCFYCLLHIMKSAQTKPFTSLGLRSRLATGYACLRLLHRTA